MATKAEGNVLTPVSGFQFTLHTTPNSAGVNFLPEGMVGFSEVSGLQDQTDAVEYKEGNDLYPDMLPGQTKPQELTLRRGLDRSNYLLVWRNAVKERTVLPSSGFRNDLYVTIWERQGAPGAAEVPTEKITVWKYKDAWVRSLSIGDLNATNSEINVQEVVICHRGAPEQVFPAFS